MSRASSSRKRAAPEADPVADLAAQNAVLQERFDTLKSLYEKHLEQSRASGERLDRLEAALVGRGEAPAAAAAAPESPVDGAEVRRLREQNEALLKSLAASRESAEQARAVAAKAEEELAAALAAGPPEELDEEAAAEALFRAKRKDRYAGESLQYFTICCSTHSDQCYFKVHRYTTISALSAQLWALKGHDIDAMKFYFEGVRLRTSDTLKGLGIGDGDEVKVVVEEVDS